MTLNCSNDMDVCAMHLKHQSESQHTGATNMVHIVHNDRLILYSLFVNHINHASRFLSRLHPHLLTQNN